MVLFFDDIGSLLPIIMMVVVWTIILNNNSKRRRPRLRQKEPQDYDPAGDDAANLPRQREQEGNAEAPGQPAPMPMEMEQDKTKRSGRDLAAEFERKLRAKSAKAADKNTDGIVTDSEIAVHRELSRAGMQTAPQAAYASAMQDEDYCTVPEAHKEGAAVRQPRRFARPALVQGFIMSQVLDKPVGLKPCDEHLSSL